MLSEEDLAVADLAYEAAFDPSLWPQLVNRMRTLLEGSQVGLILPGPEDEHDRFFSTLDPDWVRRYIEHYESVDPHILPHMTKAPLRRFFFLREIVACDVVLASEFWNDWARPQGLRHDAAIAWGFEHASPREFSGLSFWREHGARVSDAEDLARVARVVPHVDRAVRLRRRVGALRAERDALEAVLDEIPAATLLVDSHGRVRHANRAALRLAAKEDGFRLTRLGVEAATDEETRELQRAVADGISGASGKAFSRHEVLRLRRPSGAEPFEALVTPIIVGSQDPDAASTAVFVSDPATELRPPVQVLRKLWRLSRAEAALALEIGCGRTICEAAERLGIRESTARSTLKSVFAKMGVSRQAELVRRLAQGVAGIGNGGNESA